MNPHLNLKSTRIYLISPGTNKYRDRALSVLARLIDEGYQNVTFFKSLPGPNNTASLTNTCLEIFKRELTTTDPFIILEDDCAFFHKYDTLSLPPNWDALYLGVSAWAYPYPVETLYLKPRPHIVPHSEVTIESYNEELVRVKGMTATHAILFNSRAFMCEFIYRMSEIEKRIDDLPHDLLFSALASSYAIYALKNPLFYQDKTLGGQEEVTKLCLTSFSNQGEETCSQITRRSAAFL